MRLLFVTFLLSHTLFGQTYQSFYTGDTTDVTTATRGGVVLMGGASEDVNAMRWFLEQSGGGDVVVIRASGSDGYNDYLFSELGITVNSVETIVTANFNAAQQPYVAQQIRNAEALWIAGGDQGKYVQFWKNGPVENAIKYLIHTKKAVVGGTSAGMAILSDAYFSALNGSITTAEALANPYHSKMTISYSDFIDHPDLQYVITDTHYDDPDRRGRHTAFMARLTQDRGVRALGIACEEYTAVCVDSAGIGRVYGGYPQDQDYAYFLQVDCSPEFLPEICAPNQPLHWVRGEQAVRVFKAEGRSNGQVSFNLRDWQTSTGGGVWQQWWVENGVLQTSPSGSPDCLSAADYPGNDPAVIRISPNPARVLLQMELNEPVLPAQVEVLDLQGKCFYSQKVSVSNTSIQVNDWPSGMYFFRVKSSGMSYCRRVVIE